MKNLPLIFCFFIFLVLGCAGTGNTNNAPPGTIVTTPGANQPKTYTLDFPGQLERIKDEGADEAQIRKNIADADKEITFEHLKKSADKYAGRPWTLKGKILEINESGEGTVARVALDDWGNKVVWVAGAFPTDFVEKNQVYVVGYLAGNYSYTSQANWQITIPGLAARAMMKPGDVSKYQSQIKKK